MNINTDNLPLETIEGDMIHMMSRVFLYTLIHLHMSVQTYLHLFSYINISMTKFTQGRTLHSTLLTYSLIGHTQFHQFQKYHGNMFDGEDNTHTTGYSTTSRTDLLRTTQRQE